MAQLVLRSKNLGSLTAILKYSQLLNEIMPMIYKRFTDKTAEEWRQIYKVRCVATGYISPRVLDLETLRIYMCILIMIRMAAGSSTFGIPR